MRLGLVSIMMPAYNAGPYIGQAIDSVLRQTYPHWELIVIDDGSTDETADIAAGYTDERIRLYRQPNAGEAAARNAALRRMRGEFIAFLDADDLYRPDHLQAAVGYLEAHPDCHAMYTDGHYCDQQGRPRQTLSSRRRGPFQGWIFEEMIRASDVLGAPVCTVLRRNLVVSHDLEFDPDIIIGPDWDFLTRYSEFACFGNLRQPTCLYRVHGTNITVRTEARKRAESLARCREKAIRLRSFSACSAETRTFVFYDLLVNLLVDSPARQATTVSWPEFMELPAVCRARLFRLMASAALRSGARHPYVRDWLEASRQLDPSDWRGTLLTTLYHYSPMLCRRLLQARRTTPSATGLGSALGNSE